MIKTIMLDLGNVIVPVDFKLCHSGLAGVCSYPPDEIPKRIGKTGLVQRFETGEVPPEDFVREISSILGMDVTYRQFWDIWGAMLAPEPIIPDSMLEGLARDRRLLLLSNTNVIHFAMIRERYSLLRHFHGMILSYEVGALKPSPRIYREAIARAGCPAEECFFTDDVAAFADAAKVAGIDAVQFKSLEQLEGQLRLRGINW